MKTIVQFFHLVLFCCLSAKTLGQTYDSLADEINPIAQGWESFEVVAGNSGNIGPATVDGFPVWQINDILTEGNRNNPGYQIPISPSQLSKYFSDGWEFSVKFRVPQLSREGGFSGFVGFVVRSSEAPAGWAIPSGKVARVGFFLGSRSSNSFFLTPQPDAERTYFSDGGFHTVRVVGRANSNLYDWWVDGVPQGARRITAYQYAETEGTPSILTFQAGSSPAINGKSQWASVTLSEARQPTVVIDTNELSITDNGVISMNSFRGVPFTASTYNGLARFLFAGDLVLTVDDLLTSKGDDALSLTVSGNVIVPEGAVIDVSATQFSSNGGGAGGISPMGGNPGAGGSGGAFGKGGAGGKGVASDKGEDGKNGTKGVAGTKGSNGTNAPAGAQGQPGFGTSNSGGSPTSTGGRGGVGGAGGTANAAGGVGGIGGAYSTFHGHPGSKGKSPTANGKGGAVGNAGQSGAGGGGGKVQRGGSTLTGGGGGASGQPGGGGAGGGGGGGGAGGGGGGAGGGAAFGAKGYNGGAGGNGGKGGNGGAGGLGAKGGQGGFGGGALEIESYGEIQFHGFVKSRGGDGKVGQPQQSASNEGYTRGGNYRQGIDTGNDGGNGGIGRYGGHGGDGGSGGHGGRGGGGAGGTILLKASSIDTTGMTADLRGGNGAAMGEIGRLSIQTNGGNFAGKVLGDEEKIVESEHPGLQAINPHLSDLGSTPLLIDLFNGGEVAGLLEGNLGDYPQVLENASANDHAAILHLDKLGENLPGFDALIFFNLNAVPLTKPVLGVGRAGYAARLLEGGVAKNQVFGGSGTGILEALEAHGAYATLIPENAEFLTFGFTPGSTLVRRSLPLPPRDSAVYLSHVEERINGPINPPSRTESIIDLPESGPQINFGFSGDIHVVIQPPAASEAGAGWFLKGASPIYPGGASSSPLSAGEYTVGFTRVPGWLPPRDQVVTVQPDGTTTVTATFLEAPVKEIGQVAPQRVRHGDVLGFHLPAGTTFNLVSGGTSGSLSISPDGWFSYEPASRDRAPFEVSFDRGADSQIVTMTPVQDLLPEQTILALEPASREPSPSGRDYQTIHSKTATTGVNYREANLCEELTISGMTLDFDSDNDRRLFDLVHDKNNLTKVNLYADEVIVRSHVKLPGTDLTIYARRLIFEGSGSLDTTAQSHTRNESGFDPENGGNITLHLQEIKSDPTASARLILGGADTTTDQRGGDSGKLTSSFDLEAFAEIRGGIGSTQLEGTAFVSEVHEEGPVPSGLAWLHPMAVRSVLIYAKDIYYFGYMDKAGEILREYAGYLEELTALDTTPAMPDGDLAELQFAELLNDLNSVAERIADRLDYFGNSAGWVPLLSFEANFNLTEITIERAMKAFYLAHWLDSATHTITQRRQALEDTKVALSQETNELRSELGPLQDEILQLGETAEEIDQETRELEDELKDIEKRLEQKAEEIVEDRNNVPFWKSALRFAGSVMKAVPVGQPALGAVGGTLEIGSRIDEQAPLDTVLRVTDLALEYKAADYNKKAQEIQEELDSSEPASEQELERDELLEKAGKIRAVSGGVAQAGSALKSYLAERELPADEIAAELEKIRASDPQFNRVISRIQVLMDDKERFAHRIAKMEDRLREIPGIILKNRIAMITLGDSIDSANNVLDPQALSIVNEMAARNKDRLRRYFYLLAKSFEYRLLQPYRESNEQTYDPDRVLAKIETILLEAQSGGSEETVNGKPHLLSASGYESLSSVFEEELAKLSQRIISSYEKGEAEKTAPYKVELNEEELDNIGDPKTPLVVNLHDREIYPAGEESHRIAGLEVTEIDFALTIGGERVELDDERLRNLSRASIDLTFIHSGLTRLSRNGQTYAFNHFRNGDPRKNPIRWTAKVDLLSGEIIMVTPSAASDSLLKTLLKNSDLDVIDFSRPGANADIFVSANNFNVNFSGQIPTAGLGIDFTRVEIKTQLDFYNSSADRLIDVRMIDTDGKPLKIKPRVLFDNEALSDFSDAFGRRDALGSVSRSFEGSGDITISTEEFYGSELAASSANPTGYRFVHWLGIRNQQFQILSTENQVRIPNQGQQRVYAVYEQTGDLEAPEIESFHKIGSNGNLATYEVRFSEKVVGVDVTDFQIEGYSPGSAIRSVSSQGTNRLVTIDTSLVAAGDARLLLTDNDSILDYAGNSLSGIGKGNGDRSAVIEGTGSQTVNIKVAGHSRDGLIFEITGAPNTPYLIETSTTMKGNWTPLRPLTTGATGTATFTEPTGESRRFFRASKERSDRK